MVPEEMVTPVSEAMVTQVLDDKKAPKMITLDGITYELVLSPVAPKPTDAPKPIEQHEAMVHTPKHDDAVPSTSTGTTRRPIDFNTKVDEILSTPKSS